MPSPFKPEMCVTTGRLLTEWFEFPEYTDEQLEALACEANGITPEERPHVDFRKGHTSDAHVLQANINAFISKRKRVKFSHNMSNQEVQARMNEASKFVNPDNFKYLPDHVRERTGLEMNPLWLMEVMIRSGTLTAKEQISALKELAQYTHSKAASVSHVTTTEMSNEDWLLELAKEEYKVIGEDLPLRQPMQPVERGMSAKYEKVMAKRVQEVRDMESYGAERLKQLEGLVDAEFEDMGDGE